MGELLREAAYDARQRVLADIASLDTAYRESGDIFAGAFLRSLLRRYGWDGDIPPALPSGEKPLSNPGET